MRRSISPIWFSIALWLLIAAAAWPIFVVANALLSFWFGEGSFLDSMNLEPKRKLLADFIQGYKASLIIAVPLGLLAAIDYLLLARHRITRYLAGISLPIACIALALILYKNSQPALLGLAVTGLGLWLLYRIAGWLYRLLRLDNR